MTASTFGYWCEVTAEGPVYGSGQTVSCVLGTCQTISVKLALRWLITQAHRIADGLDPSPSSPWVQPTMALTRATVPDCPSELRAWCADPEEQRAARDKLKEGAPFSLVVPDRPGRYVLAVWPLSLPSATEGPPQSLGQPGRHHPSPNRHRKPRGRPRWLPCPSRSDQLDH